jgi:hypothetical protein
MSSLFPFNARRAKQKSFFCPKNRPLTARGKAEK